MVVERTRMADKTSFLAALQPVLDAMKTVSADDPDAAQKLTAAFPLDGPVLQKIKAELREGVDQKWLCDRENEGVRYSRVLKAASPDQLSIDAVHMSGVALGHTHPNGEIDLCFAVSGSPKFCGFEPGWSAFGSGSWHVPTVTDGVMDILYFLPGGAIRFEPKPVA